MAKEYTLRTVTENELFEEEREKTKDTRESFPYPDGKNEAWVEAGVNGWGLYRIATKVGRVPKEMDQLFTSYDRAVNKIKEYLVKLETKEVGQKDGTNKRSLFEGTSNGVERLNVPA